MLEAAYSNFRKSCKQVADENFCFDDFCFKNKMWLNDYALYSALRKKTSSPWYKWPSSLRKREPQAIAIKESKLKEEIEQIKFEQYIFFSQLFSLKKFCKTKNVCLIGDMPFYVTYDSADVWVHQNFLA